jgi:acylphosphatase
MIRKTIHFTGRVQGVGFRYTAQALARDFAVSGYVKNLPDGRVLLEVEGEPDEIDRFVDRVRAQMSGYVRNVESVDSAPTGEYKDFRVEH